MRGRWLKGGSTDAKLIREMLRRHGSPIGAMDAILDFGCGCGRVARHWAKLDGPDIHGADISRPSVRWCRRHLRFMHAYRCGLEPPLRFASGTFDFIYALSVLTHLPEHTGRRWLAELVRILKPGGVLLFTVVRRAVPGPAQPSAEITFQERRISRRAAARNTGGDECICELPSL